MPHLKFITARQACDKRYKMGVTESSYERAKKEEKMQDMPIAVAVVEDLPEQT